MVMYWLTVSDHRVNWHHVNASASVGFSADAVKGGRSQGDGWLYNVSAHADSAAAAEESIASSASLLSSLRYRYFKVSTFVAAVVI